MLKMCLVFAPQVSLGFSGRRAGVRAARCSAVRPVRLCPQPLWAGRLPRKWFPPLRHLPGSYSARLAP